MITKKLNSTGDTIVEVLIAITIVSFVLSGAYVSSGRSLTATRQAQERVESLKLAEEQLERLKVAATNQANSIFTRPNYFCIHSSPTGLVVRNVSNRDDRSTYHADCRRTQGGVVYYTSIDRNSDNTFTVVNRWDRAGGSGQEEARLSYRMYP